MAAYSKIASVVIDRPREDGTVRHFDIRLYEREATAASATLPLTGSIVIEEGARGDDILKPVKPAVVQFRLKDTTNLAKRIINGKKRQFKLTIDETSGGRREFEGYLRADLHKYDIFAGVQTVKLTATGELATLDQNDPQDLVKTVHSFFEGAGDDIELPREVDFYTRWRYDGQAASDPIPQLLRINEFQLIGNKPGTRADALAQLAQQMNWQVFQLDGRLIVADGYERMTSPTAAQKYSGPGYSRSTEDLTVAIDRANSIKYPDGQRSRRVGEIIMQRGFGRRRQAATPVEHGITIGQPDAVHALAYPGIAVGGDEFILREWNGTLHKNGLAGAVEGELQFGRVVFESFVGGDTLYYNPEAGEWTTTAYRWTDHFYMSPSATSTGWGIALPGGDPITLAPLPDGVLGEFRVETIFAADMSQGVEDDLTELDIASLYVTETEVAGPDGAYRDWIARNGTGQRKVYPIYQADLDRYNAANLGNSPTAIEFSTDAGSTWHDADSDWVDGTQTDPLARISARRKGKLLIGFSDRIHLRVRDLQEINPLSVIAFDDGDGAAYYSPVCIRHSLFEGYYELWMRPVGGLPLTESDHYSLQAAEGATGSGPGSTPASDNNTGSGGVTDHGKLTGLADDDHPQYLNQARGDARFLKKDQNLADIPDPSTGRVSLGLGPSDTPVFAQVQLNNPASADNHALRAGQVLNTTVPVSGGGKLRNGLDIGLNYNSTDFKVPGGELRTAQRIDQNADPLFRSLALALGLTLDDDNGYVQSETFVGDFAGSGIQLRKVNGKWRLTVDDLVIRNQFKVFEILVQQLQAGATFLLTEGHRVDEVEQVGTGTEIWDTSTETWDTSTARWTPTWKCYIPQDMLLQLDIDDLIKRQQFSGRNVGVTNATIIEKEAGDPSPTDNDPRRSFTIYIEDDGSQPPEEGFEFARIGNRTDPDRQGGIIMTSSDDGAPYERIFADVDRHDRFGQIDTIMSQRGRLDNLVDPDFAELDGSQQNFYGDYLQNILAKGKIIITGGSGIGQLDDTGLLAELDNLDEVPEGTTYGKVSRTAITSTGLITLSETVGDADDITEGSTQKFAAESGADITANNGQYLDWLLDSNDIVTGSDSITRLSGRVLDNIDDGATYARIRSAVVSNGKILLNEVIGDIGDVPDGGGYAKVASTSIQAGKLLLSEAVGDISDLADGGGFAKVASTSIQAGKIILAETIGNIGDLPDGGGYAKVASTAVSAGKVLLSETAGTLDDVAEGGTETWDTSTEVWDSSVQKWTGTYGRVKQTSLRAGYIVVKGPDGQTVIDQGQIYADELFTIDATVQATLTVVGGETKIAKGVYDSPALGPQDGILTAGGGLLVSGQGVDIDATSGTAGELEWHDTQAIDGNANVIDDLTSNGNLVGELYANASGNKTYFSMRAQSGSSRPGYPDRDSQITMIATDFVMNANAEFGGKMKLVSETKSYSTTGYIQINNIETSIVYLQHPNGDINVKYIDLQDDDALFIINDSDYHLFLDDQSTVSAPSNLKIYDSPHTIDPNMGVIVHCKNGTVRVATGDKGA